MRVSVIGGGIGGLTAALALHQKGVDVTLFEAASELRAAGAGIWMSPNSMKVMEYLGIVDRFRERSVEMRYVALLDETGREITGSPMGPVKKRHGYAVHSVKRQTLHDLLAEGIPQERIRTGKRVESLRNESDGVTARFSDGTEEQSDVLLGADGIRSTVREQINPGIPLRYSGQSCWYGLARMELPPERKGTTTEIWMGRLRFGFTDVNDGEVYFFAVESSPPHVHFEGDRAAHLRQLYEGAPAPVGEILAACKSEDIIKNDLNDIKPFLPLSSGRVALLGDAGHATTPNMGQGAAQAMEDGVLLAELLVTKEPLAAFRAYEVMRKKRIQYIVNTSWRLGQLAHTEPGIKRSLIFSVMRAVPDFVNRRMLDRVFTPVYP